MTTRKMLLVISFGLLTCCSFAQNSARYIFFRKPYTDSSKTNLYKDTIIKFDYKLQYKNIKNADVNADVENAVKHNDFRIVSISGNSYLYPGLEGGYQKLKNGGKIFIGLSSKYEGYVTKYGFKIIKGTSDAMMAGAPPLQSVAYDYAEKYNKLLMVKIKNAETRLKNGQ